MMMNLWGFLAIVVCSAAAASPVVILAQNNYTDFLESNDLVLVEFLAPWCGHCRKMGKEYENAASTLQRLKSTAKLAVIDASLQENYGLVDTAHVEGYPSFLLYRNGQHVLSYSGLRKESNFVDYMLQKNAPLITEASSVDEVLKYFSGLIDPTQDESVGEEHFCFVGMSSDEADNVEGQEKSLYHIFEDVSARNDNANIHFIFSDAPSVLEYFSVDLHTTSSVASVALLPKGNVEESSSNSILRTDITSISDLQNFVSSSCSRNVIPFEAGNLHLLRSTYAPKNQVLVFCDESDTSGKLCMKIVQDIAPAYRGTFLFVSVSHRELHLYHTFGMKIGTPHAQIVILNVSNEHELRKYVLDTDTYNKISEKQKDTDASESKKEKTFDLSESLLNEFLKMYLSQELRPFYRTEEDSPDFNSGNNVDEASEAEPTDETEEERMVREDLSPVRVSSATLIQKVIESRETVLLFITAPWCGHCKSLEPVIHSLAKLLHQRKRKYDNSPAIPSLAGLPVTDDIVATNAEAGAWDDVVVAQIDGSLNDIHSLGSVDVNGFPTIVFVRYVEGKKEAIEYTGERSVKDMLQYIHKNGVPLTASTSSEENYNEEL